MPRSYLLKTPGSTNNSPSLVIRDRLPARIVLAGVSLLVSRQVSLAVCRLVPRFARASGEAASRVLVVISLCRAIAVSRLAVGSAVIQSILRTHLGCQIAVLAVRTVRAIAIRALLAIT